MRLYLFAIMFLLLIFSPVSSNQMISAGDGSLSIASGDMAELTGYANGSSFAWLWMFTFQKNGDIYALPINTADGNFKIKIPNTTKLPEGRYMMVVEFGGDNNIQEVEFDFNKSEFTSPWREPRTLRASDNPYERIKQIESYCKNNAQYCDDTFFTTNITIEKPFIKFTDMYQYTFSDIYQGKSDEKDITKSGMLYLGGETNIDPSNPITIILDNNQTVKAVIEQPDPYGYYKWSAFLDISKLRTGSHPITISSPKLDDITTYLDIGYSQPTPKPTPTPIKVVSNEFVSTAGNTVSGPGSVTVKPTTTSKQFVPAKTTSIPTPTEVPIKVSTPSVKENMSEEGYAIVAVQTTKSNKIPLNPIYTIIGVIAIFLYIRKFK